MDIEDVNNKLGICEKSIRKTMHQNFMKTAEIHAEIKKAEFHGHRNEENLIQHKKLVSKTTTR